MKLPLFCDGRFHWLNRLGLAIAKTHVGRTAHSLRNVWNDYASQPPSVHTARRCTTAPNTAATMVCQSRSSLPSMRTDLPFLQSLTPIYSPAKPFLHLMKRALWPSSCEIIRDDRPG